MVRRKSDTTMMVQMERIYTLYAKGYGTKDMLARCECIIAVVIRKNGY